MAATSVRCHEVLSTVITRASWIGRPPPRRCDGSPADRATGGSVPGGALRARSSRVRIGELAGMPRLMRAPCPQQTGIRGSDAVMRRHVRSSGTRYG
jgi:hypothetical protein